MKRRYYALMAGTILSLNLLMGCGQTAAADTGADAESATEAVTPTEAPEKKEETEPTAAPTVTPTEVPEATAAPTPTEAQPTTAQAQPTATPVEEQPQPTVAEVQPTAAPVAEQPQTTPAPVQSQSISSMSFDEKCDASYNTRGELAPHSTVYINGVAYEYCGKNPANGTTIDDPKWYNHPEAALMSAEEIYEKCWTYEEDPATGTLKQTRHDDWMEDADMRDYRFYWVIQQNGDYDGYYD